MFRRIRATSDGGGPGAVCEPLESRQMLAALSGYYPLGTGDTWSYSGVLREGGVATSVSALHVNVPAPDGSTIESFSISGGDVASQYRRYITSTADGITISRADYQSRDALSWQDDYLGGFGFLSSTISDGDFKGYGTAPDSGQQTPSGRRWVGYSSGSIAITSDTVTTPAGTFDALKITQVSTATRSYGMGFTGTGVMNLTLWLVKGLGIARIQYFADETLNGADIGRRRFDLSLTDSTRLDGLAHAQVTGNGVRIANDDTSPVRTDGTAFGRVEAYDGSVTKTFVITNTGSEPLKLRTDLGAGGISFSGMDAALFSVVQRPDAVVAPGASTSFSVRFAPAGQTGLRQATVIVQSRADNSAYTFAVQGTGETRGVITVQGGPGAAPVLPGSTATFGSNGTDFGSVGVGSGFARRFIVQNTGAGAFVFPSDPTYFIAIVGNRGVSNDFSVTVQPPMKIGAGMSAVFRVRFTPTAPGLRHAQVVIINTSTNQPEFRFDITGMGV